MFVKDNEAAVSFKSCWKTEQQLETQATQTEDIQRTETASQVTDVAEAGVQTEEDERRREGTASYDEASLAAFLHRITPKVIEELDKQARSRAFEGFSLTREEETTHVKLLHTLRCNNLDKKGVVTGSDWNSTGSVIGVTYGWRSHDDWCDHKSAVAVWNLNRSDFDANQPERVIEVSSCVASIAFHPTNPAIFAVGTFSGEVLVYDLSRVEEVVAAAAAECGGSVTAVAWLAGRGSAPVAAATATGHLFIFAFNTTKQTLKLTSGYMVQGRDIPRSQRVAVDEAGGVGITSMSFNTEDTSLFVLGVEGGAMCLCSTESQVPAGVEFGGLGLRTCVTSVLGPHTGRVLSTHCSKHHRNAILTAASDNQIRLYTLLQPNKAVSVRYSEEDISCVQWSPSRPLVAAVGDVSGQVSFYDVSGKTSEPLLLLPAAEKPAPITMLNYNNKNVSRIAVGDQLSRVSIWQLPDIVVSPTSTEHSALVKLLTNLTD